MTEMVVATYDDRLFVGRVEAAALGAGGVVDLHLVACEDAALGVFEGVDGLGAVPRTLSGLDACRTAGSEIGAMLTELGQVGATIRVDGDLNSLTYAFALVRSFGSP